VRPVEVVIDAPVLYWDLGLEDAVELLDREQLVAQAGVERLNPGVVPWRSRIDVDRAGA
jgi:hypothetical protein